MPSKEIEVPSHLVIIHSIVPVGMDGRMFYRAKHFDIRNWWKTAFRLRASLAKEQLSQFPEKLNDINDNEED